MLNAHSNSFIPVVGKRAMRWCGRAGGIRTRHFIRGILCSLLTTGSLLGLSAPSVAYARPHDKAQCRLDRVVPAVAGGTSFGSGEVVSQTFVLRVPSRVCMVRLLLRRNVGRAQAGPVVLTVLAAGQVAPLFTAVLRADSTPEDAAGAFTFSFGCDPGGPPPAPYYAMELSSPDSALGAYTWVGGDAWGFGWSGGYTVQVFTCQ